MRFKSVAILGIGAVGSYVCWGLSKKAKTDPLTGLNRTEKDVPGGDLIDLCVIASGERKARLERDGLVINDVLYHPAVRTPGEARGVDLLIVALKYNGLRPALEDIKAITDDHTTVISLMNGVDSEEIIGEALGSTDNIVWSLVKVTSARSGNTVRFDPEAAVGIFFGERQTSEAQSRQRTAAEAIPDVTKAQPRTDRTDALCALFKDTGLHYTASADIMKDIWIKFRLNMELNLTQAVLGCGAGAYRDSAHARAVRLRLGGEVSAIAEAKGIHIAQIDSKALVSSSKNPGARYSTLQDLDAKRHTEIEMFSGTVVRMGRELGIPTPYNDCIYHLIKALEEKNDGLFDYT